MWVAQDRARGRTCAAKVLNQADSAALLRFVREQGVQVDHPHLASPYGWAAEDHEVAIAMPLVAGGSLEGALADHGAFGEPLVACLLLQVLDGLAGLHAAGWVHRDVKPANVLLEPTGTGEPHARLGDMGLAMRVDDARLTHHGSVHGTPGYVAPEVLAGAAPAPAQDLYAAGATAVRLLRPDVALEDAAQVDAALASVVSAELAALVGRDGLLSRHPEERETAALAAPVLLAELAAAREDGGGYLTAAHEPFEVFDHAAGVLAGDEAPVQAPAAAPRAEDVPPSPAVPTVRIDDDPTDVLPVRAVDAPAEAPAQADAPVTQGSGGSAPARSGLPLWLGLLLMVLGLGAVVVAILLLTR